MLLLFLLCLKFGTAFSVYKTREPKYSLLFIHNCRKYFCLYLCIVHTISSVTKHVSKELNPTKMLEKTQAWC